MGFRHSVQCHNHFFVFENSILLGYNSASSVISNLHFETACRSHLQGSIVLISCHLSEGRKVKPGTFILLPEVLRLLLLP